MKQFKFDKKTDNLFQAILSLENKTDAEKFFRDLCTIQEIKDMADRWEIVRRLEAGEPYRKISEKLGVSTTTVSRVALWLSNGESGYRLVLDKLNNFHHHKNLPKKRL